MINSIWLFSVILPLHWKTKEFVQWSKSNDAWFFPIRLFSYFVTSLRRHGVRIVIEVIWQMNDSIWLSSVILSLRYKDTYFVLWSKSTDKWLIAFDSVQLLLPIAGKTRSPCSDRNHMTYNSFRLLSSAILSLCYEDTDIVPCSQSFDKRIILIAYFHLFSHFARKTRSSYHDRSDMTNEWFNMALFSYFVTSIQNHRVLKPWSNAY